MSKIILDDEDIKSKKDLLLKQVNLYLAKQKVDTYKDFLKLAKNLKRKFGGEIIPANEPKAKRLGFVWSFMFENRMEVACNPVIDEDKCSEKEIKEYIQAILKV